VRIKHFLHGMQEVRGSTPRSSTIRFHFVTAQFSTIMHKSSAFLIVILAAVTAIGPLTIDMYLPAFSAIASGLNASESSVQLSLTSYFIGIACSQIIYGPIIDRFGKKIPLFCGLAIFVATSFACTFVTEIHQLIFLRFFQAAGACAGMVIPRALVRDIFPPQDSARVFSHLMSIMGLAPILAPLGGSIILSHFDWRGIFVFLTIFGIFCLAVTYTAIPSGKPADINAKLSGSLKNYWKILQDRNFTICALTSGMCMSALFAYITASPFIYLKLFNLSAKNFGLIFSINSICFVIAAQINAYFLKKFPLETVLGKAILLPAIVGFSLILVSLFHPNFLTITIALGAMLVSIGAIIPNTTALSLKNHLHHSGSASALLGTFQFVCATATSFLASHLYDGSTMPLAIIVGSCGICGCLIFKTFRRS